MSAIICLNTCWSCKFNNHFDEPTPHTWMDEDDIEAIDQGERIDRAALRETHPCACTCAGGPGGCHAS